MFPLSYSEKNGAPDTQKPDRGRRKIDFHVINRRDHVTLEAALLFIPRLLPHFGFIHLRGPDTRGHWRRWMSAAYRDEVVRQDGHLKRLLKCIEGTPALRGKTTLLVTTDHGGSGFSHGRNSTLAHYRIPWFAWGKGVARGKDLYALNRGVRVEPGRKRIPRQAPLQPIRNGDVANVVARLLGLPAIKGSQIGRTKPLRLR